MEDVSPEIQQLIISIDLGVPDRGRLHRLGPSFDVFPDGGLS